MKIYSREFIKSMTINEEEYLCVLLAVHFFIPVILISFLTVLCAETLLKG